MNTMKRLFIVELVVSNLHSSSHVVRPWRIALLVGVVVVEGTSSELFTN